MTVSQNELQTRLSARDPDLLRAVLEASDVSWRDDDDVRRHHRLLGMQRRMVARVAHDMGTPLAAAQLAGLATLTHTPSPMKFLSEVLGRPETERPFLLIPVGYPADDCMVPKKALLRRPLNDVMKVV